MPIFGHSKFTPVFLGKLLEKIWNSHFGCSEFVPAFLGKIVRKNMEQPFWHFFLEKIVGKNLEWLFLAGLNLYQSFWEKLSEKIEMATFGHSEFILVFLGKFGRKNSKFLAILILF